MTELLPDPSRPFVVDTHTHVIASDEHEYPLDPTALSGAWYRDAPTSAEQLIECMGGAGVDCAVLVQPMGAYSYDNSYAADSSRSHPGRFASACCVDVLGADPIEQLTYWVGERGMHGVRLFALSRGDSWLTDPATYPVWERAAELGAHVIVTILGHQLPDLGRVLADFPHIPVSLDHCGFPQITSPPYAEAAPLFDLAALPNLFVKVSTNVLDLAARDGGEPQDFIAALATRFGAERMMWGSDFSQTHDRTYTELVELARRSFSAMGEKEAAWCLGETALRLWPSLSETKGQAKLQAKGQGDRTLR